MNALAYINKFVKMLVRRTPLPKDSMEFQFTTDEAGTRFFDISV